jgi:hypothetical protein
MAECNHYTQANHLKECTRQQEQNLHRSQLHDWWALPASSPSSVLLPEQQEHEGKASQKQFEPKGKVWHLIGWCNGFHTTAGGSGGIGFALHH